MKSTLNFLIVICLSVLIMTACKKDDTNNVITKVPSVPSKMTVDVPSSLNFENTNKNANDGITPLRGNDIYKTLRGFVWIGTSGASIVNNLITVVKALDQNKITELAFTSKDDGLKKTLTITQNATFKGVQWEWKMLVLDQDGSTALEMFWNQNPVKGVTIYQSYKLNHNSIFSVVHKNALVQIDYSEAESAYSAQMIVTIAGLTMTHTNDPNNIKMFVGKRKSDGILDIWGNTNSPKAIIVDTTHTGGREWAFVAHSDQTLNISVAKVALPECNVTDISTLWDNYSIDKVLNDELTKIGASQSQIDEYLANAHAPGYFVSGTGFIACGPGLPANHPEFTQSFCDLSKLSPYIPNDINTLKLTFSK